MEESLMLLKEKFHLKDTDAGQYSPLVLAYLGDAAYGVLKLAEPIVRRYG